MKNNQAFSAAKSVSIFLIFLAPFLNAKTDIAFSGLTRAEQFYARNYSLFNKNSEDVDQIWFVRNYIDLNLNVVSDSGVDFKVAVRSKMCPGILGSVGKTHSSEVKIGDTVVGSHAHTLPLQIFWIREGRVSFDLSELLGLSFAGDHVFKIGSFPFSLGRGISLGDAYAVGPEVLGFWTESAIDQFAYGALLSGDIVPKVLTYDFYAAILQNKCGTLGDTGAKIFGQEIGRIGRQERGFGYVNFIIAGRALWSVFDTPAMGKLVLEPYAMYNADPEQKLEFVGDASSRLGTVGVAADYKGDRFECGFDTSVNLGYQKVKGWDRNQISQQNLNGALVVINSSVTETDTAGTRSALFVPPAQTIIDSSAQGESHNGEVIGSYANPANLADIKTLTNATNRFRDNYTNKYEGWMFVADASAWLYKKDLSASVEVGVASGDDNPNIDTQDRVYSGFIGTQEVYSGNRVRSAFVLGGAGRLPRPLSKPLSNQAPTPFSNVVSGFSNLVLGGAALKWAPKDYSHKFTVNPNIIAYFQHYQTRAFDALTGTELACNASPALGVETNLFFDYCPAKDIKVYGVGSVFVPGQHYTDIKGRPLNKEQQKYLDKLNRTGFDTDKLPNIGDNTAFTINIGIQYSF